MSTKPIRRLTDVLAQYEGYWFLRMRTDDVRTFSLFTFSYNKRLKSYCFSGRDYSHECSFVNRCVFDNVQEASSGVFYTGMVYKEGQPIENVGRFFLVSPGNIDGFFFNVKANETTFGSFDGILLTSEDIFAMIGTKTVEGANYDKLAFSYYEKINALSILVEK